VFALAWTLAAARLALACEPKDSPEEATVCPLRGLGAPAVLAAGIRVASNCERVRVGLESLGCTLGVGGAGEGFAGCDGLTVA